MALSDFAPLKDVVKFPGGEFSVRALNLSDVSDIISQHYGPIDELYQTYVVSARAMPADSLQPEDAVLDALKMFPEVIDHVVALAADASDAEAQIVTSLPTTVKLDAVEKLIKLTLTAEGGLEKLVGAISRVAQSLGGPRAD